MHWYPHGICSTYESGNLGPKEWVANGLITFKNLPEENNVSPAESKTKMGSIIGYSQHTNSSILRAKTEPQIPT